MLDKILNTFIGAARGLKLSVVDTFGGLDSFAFEAPFMDDGLIITEINSRKEEYKRNADQLTQCERFGEGDEYRQEKNQLYNRQISLRTELAYLFSHNPAKLDDSLGLLEGSQNSFIICIEAMKHYQQGNEDLSLEKFTEYMNQINGVPNHYLACKMLGSLLVKQNQYQYAIPILRTAVERRPEDIELYNMLIECYKAEGMDFELGVASSAALLLSSDNLLGGDEINEYN
jgi:predicted Zn-dependent protease